MPTIELPQGTLRYEDVGTGPAVVFIHGLLVNGKLWRNVTPELSRSARCIVPDLPLGSHPFPMNPDADLSVEGVAKLVADLLEALDLRDVTLVGNDSGGAISQVVAARHGERVGRLVLTTCDAYEVFPPPLFSYLRLLPVVPGLVTVLAKSMFRVKALRDLPLAYGWLAKSGIPDEIVKSYVKPCATDSRIRRDVKKFVRTVSPALTLKIAKELQSFDRPVLLLWTPEDRFFPVSLAERLCEDLPNARLELIDDAYVFVAEDQPERVAREIARFVATEATDGVRAPVN
ncbi:MAG: alpha/beta hydrolase [Myxococcales bacterium]|nr:alpha/beta hydrolase [Myxococcales bacterium]MDH3483799.1 alpha/beta hydrolase [Myxococcales bacterium]